MTEPKAMRLVTSELFRSRIIAEWQEHKAYPIASLKAWLAEKERPECDECGQPVKRGVELTAKDDSDDSIILCDKCIREAAELVA